MAKTLGFKTSLKSTPREATTLAMPLTRQSDDNSTERKASKPRNGATYIENVSPKFFCPQLNPLSSRDAIMTMLNGPLNKTPIDAATRSEIIESFWPANGSSRYRQDELDWESYFRYYARQCHDALIDQGQHVLARTHQDILDVAHQLEDLTPRDAIKENLRSRLSTRHRPNEDEILDGAIDLAARLHLMVNIAVDKPVISGQAQLKWKSGILRDFLNHYFSEPQVLGNNGIKLEQMFTASNLERIAGIQIKPTDNLADHLRMIDKEDKVVAIFHHASFLKRQNRCIWRLQNSKAHG